MPSTPSIENQTNIIGPNSFPMEAVPNCWRKKKAARMLNTIKTIVLSVCPSIRMAGSSRKPSIAEVIEIGGVIIPSARRAAPPSIAG